MIVKHIHKDHLEKYDRMLRRFEHSKALDAAMHVSKLAMKGYYKCA